MAEELMVVLKRSENLGFGFSLLGTTGLPHVIYDIVENSPAAECGEVEAGDIIVKVNGTDVHRFTTKEVLKCLRLSQDPVTLELKRDPKIKAHVRKYLAQTSNQHHSDVPPFVLDDINELSTSPNNRVTSPINSTSPINQQQRPHGACHRISSSDPISRPSRIPTAKGVGVRSPLAPTSATSSSISKSAPQSPHGINNNKRSPSHIPTSNGTNNNCGGNNQILPPPNNKARFEAYMMTGDLILNLSRTQQSSGLITSHSKKIDSLRDSPTRVATRRNGSIAPTAKCDSIPSSPTYSDTESISSLKTIGDNLTEKDNSVTNNSDSNSIKLIKNNKQNILKNNNNHTCDLMNTENNIPSGCAVSSLSSSAVKNKINDFKLSEWNSEVDSGGGGCGGSASSSSSGLLYQGDGDYVDHTVRGSNVDSGLVNTNNIDNLSIKNIQTNASSVSSSSSATIKSELISSPDPSFSVPTSPTSLSTSLIEGLTITKHKETANSVPTSPESSAQEIIRRSNQQHNGVVRKCDAAGFRTSKSEDHLQATQRDGGLGAVVPIDIDEDVNSSLNTLLDTRHDCDDSQNSDRDRIVWTYNAPIVPTTQAHTGGNSSNSHSSSISSSPQRSGSPASPTSVSSSVMSSNSGSKGGGMNSGFHNLMCPINGDQSVSEAVSNISSPDYQDDDNLLSSRDMAAMAISDPSDSDSTILVSDAHHHVGDRDHRIVIQVKGAENQSNHGYTELKDSEDELATLTEEPPTVVIGGYDGRESSPPISDDGSDVESLHSYHYSPKAVDIPSAVRLAKRLYGLDGFKKSDVSRHLSKNNDFSRAVADEYLKYFNFDKISLDAALRQFLQQFSLSGETQERERVLVHFSKRYLDCNPCTFNSQDAVHTLTCAIMLLNTDLHGQNIGRKMTCAEFIDNLAELNDGENFPKDILKCLYQAIKNHPLEWALDEESPDQPKARGDNSLQGPPVGPNPFLEAPQNVAAIEYKKGYVMRKCCYDSNYKKTPFGKRSWKMFYCTLRDLVLYLHKDEHGFRKNSMSDNVHNAIRIHHGLATKAQDYTKKQHVFRLQTADQAEYLFQTSDSKELQSWIDTINYVCAQFSAPPLEGGVGSQKRFQRPLLPSSHTKLLLRDQLAAHEERVNLLEMALMVHKGGVIPTKGLPLQNYKEKETYLNYELKRYKTYVYILSARMGAEQAEFMMNNEIVGEPTSPNFLQHSLNLQNTAANIVVAAAAAAAAAQASAAAAAATGQSLSPIGCMPTIIAATTMASSTTSTTITGNTTMTSINSAGANQLQNIGVITTQQQQGSCLQQQQQQQQQQQHATNRVIEAKYNNT